MTLLKRGLKFTPTPKQDKKEHEADPHEFQRKLRLLEYFNESQPQRDISIVKNKSNFVPPRSDHDYMSLVMQSLSQLPDTNNSTSTRRKTNISHVENVSLNKLKNDDNIIIKQADKGCVVLVMDKIFYKQKILELLENQENCIELEENEDHRVLQKVKYLMKEHTAEVTNENLIMFKITDCQKFKSRTVSRKQSQNKILITSNFHHQKTLECDPL